MFYIGLFFKTLKENILVAIIFTLVSGVLIASSVGQSTVSLFLSKKLSQNNELAYFYALISSKENYHDVARKLRSLDEVYRIEMVSKETISGEVKKILGEIDVDGLKSVLQVDYVGLKIIFSKAVGVRAQNLVKEYVTRLVGKNNVMLGSTKSAKKNVKGFIAGLNKYAYPLVLVAASLMWLISFFIIRRSVLKVAYIVEQYQRKTNVLLKTILSGLILFFTLFSIPACILMHPNFINLMGVVFLFTLSLVTCLKKYRWDS